MTRTLFWKLVLIAALAVCIRLAYQEGMNAFGGSYNNGSDSNKYLSVAETLVDTGKFGTKQEEGTVTDAPSRLPLYEYFLAAIFKLSHSKNLRIVVSVQSILDFFSIIAIGLIALSISSRLVLPSAILAAIAPNFIVQTSYILQESLFLVFFTWGLCAMLWALRSRKPAWLLVAAGLLLGFGLITRLALAYYGFFIAPLLFYAFMRRADVSVLRSAALSILPLLSMSLVAAPIVFSNYQTYGYAQLSSQTGSVLLNWTYACLATPVPCAGRKGLLPELNQIQEARFNGSVARTQTRSRFLRFKPGLQSKRFALPLWQVAFSTAYGMTKTLTQSGFYEVLSQFRQPTSFFGSIRGANFAERLVAFITSNSRNYFMLMWFVAQLCLIGSRLVQLYGIYIGIRKSEIRSAVVLLGFTALYFIALIGPILSPRYRIPAEPTLIIFFALGYIAAADWVRQKCEIRRSCLSNIGTPTHST